MLGRQLMLLKNTMWFYNLLVKNLAKKPASGGMPAKENNTINNDKDANGWFFDIPDSSLIFSWKTFSLFIIKMQPNAPRFITKYIVK